MEKLKKVFDQTFTKGVHSDDEVVEAQRCLN